MLEFVDVVPDTPSIKLNLTDILPNNCEIMLEFVDFVPDTPSVRLYFADILLNIGEIISAIDDYMLNNAGIVSNL